VHTTSFRRTELRSHFWRTVIDCLRHKPRNLEMVLGNVAFYLHVGSFAQFLIENLDRQIQAIDDEAAPQLQPQPQPLKVALPA
jgi:hypothetical protein